MRRRGGFTLLEVIVALSILAIIATLTFASIQGALAARDMLEGEDEVNQIARVAMDKIRRDLQLAYLTKSTSAVNTYRTIFVAQNQSPDRVWFTSLSHKRLYRDARESDQTEITLWTEDDPHVDDAMVLLRREAPRIDHEPEKDGVIQPLAYKVKAFELRFLDSLTSEWKDEWDTTGTDTPNRLPRAAQITLTLLAPDPDDDEKLVERPFLTTVVLQFAPALTPKGGVKLE
ncbi:MAG: type II secretion system protein GspJ [Myxococcota bacterium]